MLLKPCTRLGVMEDILERRVLQSRSVDVTSDPIVVEHRRLDLLVVHVIRGAGDTGVVLAALPDEFEEVVDAGEDVVHEDDAIEVLTLGVAQFVQRDEGGVADFCEVFDTVVEGPASTGRSADNDTHADAPRQSVENA